MSKTSMIHTSRLHMRDMLRSLSLRKKAILFLIPLIILMSIIYTYTAIRTERSILKNEILKKGETIARIAAINAELPILSENMELLQKSAFSLKEIKDVAFVQFTKKNLDLLIHQGIAARTTFPHLSPMTPVTYLEQTDVFDFYAPVFTVLAKEDIDIFQEVQQQPKREHVGWVRVALSKEVMNQTVREFVVKGSAFAIIFTSCGILILYVLIALATRPILSLLEAVKGIREGEYHEIEAVATSDEIGELTAEFNRMSRAVKEREERITEMMEQIQGQNVNLDRLVKERTAQLEEANRELKEMDEMKTSFLATVSHELRTPLTAVLGFSAIIHRKLRDHLIPSLDLSQPKTEKTAHQVLHDIDIIRAEGERLTALINDVLDLTKLESGKLDWNIQPLSIDAVISRAASATSVLFQQKGIQLQKEMEKELPEVMGDHDRLIQVVINLFSNAVKFTESGTITCRAAREGAAIKVSIIDNGMGIATDDHEKIFEKFTQVGDTLTDRPRGTGLGLPICRQIVEYHGGTIGVESKIGRGSTFYFTLPVVASADRPEPDDKSGEVEMNGALSKTSRAC